MKNDYLEKKKAPFIYTYIHKFKKKNSLLPALRVVRVCWNVSQLLKSEGMVRPWTSGHFNRHLTIIRENHWYSHTHLETV